MTSTDLVAYVGAITGTAALVWQIVTWRVSRRTRLGVSVQVAGGRIYVTVVNHGDQQEHVESVHLVATRLSGEQFDWRDCLADTGQAVALASRASKRFTAAQPRAEHVIEDRLNLARPIYAVAITATDETFRSKPVRITALPPSPPPPPPRPLHRVRKSWALDWK